MRSACMEWPVAGKDWAAADEGEEAADEGWAPADDGREAEAAGSEGDDCGREAVLIVSGTSFTFIYTVSARAV